jgi:hypothetical protein
MVKAYKTPMLLIEFDGDKVRVDAHRIVYLSR